MSQEAYELLLEANHLFSQNKKDEAICAYREVLRLDPSPHQRLVAEEQLRALGELPYTFATSGKVIRRQAQGGYNKSKGRERRRGATHRGESRKPPQGKHSATKTDAWGAPPDATRGAASTHNTKTSMSGWNGNKKWGASQSASSTKLPPSRSEKLLSALDSMFHLPEDQTSTATGLAHAGLAHSGSAHSSSAHAIPVHAGPVHAGPVCVDSVHPGPAHSCETPDSRAARLAQPCSKAKQTRSADPALAAVQDRVVDDVAEQSQPAAQLPRPRSYESEESFQRRLQRYQIWNKYREQHPDIDLNTAVRLEETGWTLEQLRATQKQRRQRYLSRKKQYTRARQEKNQTFSGTQYMETVISEQVGLWSFGSDATEWVGYLLQNDLYRWHVRDESGERRVFHKLQLGCVCELEQRSAIWELCRLEEQQRASGEVPSELPHERFHIPDELLLRSLEQEQPMAFQLFCGLWFWGWVYWYDPYQLSLVLNVDEQEDELVEVMVFRHSIKSIAPELPTSWNNLPTLAWHRQTTTQP